jgi:hypothetical protein
MGEREFTGTLQRADLGTGGYLLLDDQGERWQLDGDVPAELVGRRVRVTGRVGTGFGFVMAGPVLEVRRVRGE